MIRMIQSKSAAHAKSYFAEALSKADYYVNDQEVKGRIHGKLAERLKISGEATKEIFDMLCENTNPLTKGQLTARNDERRTVGYDINFHCPKSVSVLHCLSKDDTILKAFEKSYQETMLDIQNDAMTRVRKDGQDNDRKTSELVWADFIHQTARPVDGRAPDPHLHSHCFVFNATFDDKEAEFKAVQFRFIKRDMPFYQACFHKRLADNLIEKGFDIQRTDKSFEVVNVPKKVLDLFSKRTDEIGRIAKEQGITDAKEKAELGARTRSKKQNGMSMDELKTEWRKQIAELGEKESQGEPKVWFAPEREKIDFAPSQCIDFALEHCFDKKSVISERRLLETAYRHALGSPKTTLDMINDSFRNDKRVILLNEYGETVCTTHEVFKEEKRMVELAKEGKGQIMPLYTKAPPIALNGQQKAAVEEVLTTSNMVSIIRGAAGTGKTTLTHEAYKHMKAVGKEVTFVAPTAEASRGVLRREGFESANTVSALIFNREMQQNLKGQVLWVDEAGLIGTKDMKALLEITKEQNARLILSGDTKQHSSVARGDALRILNTVAGIKAVEVNKIYRQKPEDYRSVVESLSKGNVKDGFEKLNKMGGIIEIDPLNPTAKLVEQYMNLTKKGKVALVISPTHRHADEVTDGIRRQLKANRKLGKKEIKALRLTDLKFTDAQKKDTRNYSQGQVIQLNQNVTGMPRGSRWKVDHVENHLVRLKNEQGFIQFLPWDKPDFFTVFNQSEVALAKGDKIRVTKLCSDENGKRLENGQVFTVEKVSKKGDITIRNNISKAKYEINQNFGHLSHAHCITSQTSQSKTVDYVLSSQPADTFPASDAKQFYVTVSRAREGAFVFTDDKEKLLEHVARLRDRLSAMEAVKYLTPIEKHLKIHQLQKAHLASEFKKPTTKKDKDHDYER